MSNQFSGFDGVHVCHYILLVLLLLGLLLLSVLLQCHCLFAVGTSVKLGEGNLRVFA